MRDKWETKEIHDGRDGQAVIPQRITLFPESYRPKLSKRPSMRAISNYYNISTEPSETNSYDNLCFIPENGDDMEIIPQYEEPYMNISTINSNHYYSYTSNSSNTNTLQNGISMHTFNTIGPGKVYLNAPEDGSYDYTTVRSYSVRTNNTSASSDLGSDRKDDLGSTAKLVSPKIESSCRTWFAYLETILCTISLAAGFGNIYRLPQVALIRGGLPFLVVYVILVLVLGLPLLFLELGLGQLAQEGFIKTWRAVPFFRGVGYVKLIAGCLLTVYYPVYMGLCLYYVIWTLKGSLPFPECAVVKMREDGYSADGVDGETCLKKTFLAPPFSDPYWYGIYAALLFLIWTIVIAFSLRRTKSYVRSLSILLFPTLGCLIAQIVRAVYLEKENLGLHRLIENVDWSTLQSANIWYYAAIQVFFSTNIGFGTFVTNAGIIYNKVNPFWMSLVYVATNILFGAASIILTYILSANLDYIPTEGIGELHLITLIYNSAISSSENNIGAWTVIAFVTFLCTGFISTVTLVYTLLKVIRVETGHKYKWRTAALFLSFLGFLFGCALLLGTDFKIVHLLDHYVVGNLILITVIIEVFAFVLFYGGKRIQIDFEFMMGRLLSKIWMFLWWLAPIALTGIFVWGLATLPLTGLFDSNEDPIWIYGIGWAIVVTMLIFIFVNGIYIVTKQEYFTFNDKFRATLKPSRKWGPTDPIMRHTWMQWQSKAQEGERDFTLKRRGTRDYTHSIKKRPYTQASDENSIISTTPTSPKNDQNQNSIRVISGGSSYDEPYYLNNNFSSSLMRISTTSNLERPLRVTSLVDSLDPAPVHQYNRNAYSMGFKKNINPLARPNTYNDTNDSSISEGYGTFRKGPYIINDDMGHVCHRKYSQSEDATEL